MFQNYKEELIKSFVGVQGAVFQKSPLVAEGNVDRKFKYGKELNFVLFCYKV